MDRVIPGICIAGTNSGCGKTTISMGIMAALSKQGRAVQPFKVGPDYIDPMFHTHITGRSSSNLDSWMLGEDVVRHLFSCNSQGADISVIEGVMGYYDGYGGTSLKGSTYEVASILGVPVILVVDGSGTALSIAATVKGFVDFRSPSGISGVIINNIKSEAHYALLKKNIEHEVGIRVLGWLKRSDEYLVKGRHLGLVPSEEVEGLSESLEQLAKAVSETVDLDAVMQLAKSAKPCEAPGVEQHIEVVSGGTAGNHKPTIAVAKDRAFNFYYSDNIRLLEELGARIEFFSPLDDESIPDDADALYFGGGFPEVFADRLSKNASMKKSISDAVDAGIPAIAECGGLMYMSSELRLLDGEIFSMAGILPTVVSMTKSLKRFGYVEVEFGGESRLIEPGTRLRAHEFHYSEVSDFDMAQDASVSQNAVKVTKGKREWSCGYSKGSLLALYPHIHFWANPSVAYRFVDRARAYSLVKRLHQGD